MQAYLPSDPAFKDQFTFTKPDLAKIKADGKKDLAISTIKLGNRPAQLLLRGVLTTQGINKMESEWGDKYSFGLQFTEQEDADGIGAMLAKFEDHLGEIAEEEYELKDVFKDDDVVYLKVKTDKNQNAFTFASNYKLHPKKINPDIVRYMPIEVVAEPGAYINVKNQTAGLFFTVRQITFREHEEDAVELSDVLSQPDRKASLPTPAPATPNATVTNSGRRSKRFSA